jgi:hypothetical protein
MAHEKMKKSCNINGPVSLAELGRSYCGFQKMDFQDSVLIVPKKDFPSDVVVSEYINSPWDLNKYPGSQPEPNDPFGECATTTFRSWSHTWSSSNANMFLDRKDPNSTERIRWKFTIKFRGSMGCNVGIVVTTYPERAMDRPNETVVYADTQMTNTAGTQELDIDLPANGDQTVVFSLQCTAPASSMTQFVGMSIYDWEVKFR